MCNMCSEIELLKLLTYPLGANDCLGGNELMN